MRGSDSCLPTPMEFVTWGHSIDLVCAQTANDKGTEKQQAAKGIISCPC